MHPAAPGAGISFKLAPSANAHPTAIAATYRNVKSSALCTSLEAPDRSWGVSTVEHMMAAFAGLGITDVEVEVDGPEVPLLDGGAGPFALALHPMIVALDRPLSILRIKREVKVTAGRQTARLLPSETPCGLDMKVAIDFTVLSLREFLCSDSVAHGPGSTGGNFRASPRRLYNPGRTRSDVYICCVGRRTALSRPHSRRLTR